MLLNLCQSRASVRAYLPQLPKTEAIEYICECVRLAPSAVNRQPWRIFYVTAQPLLEKLRATYPREWFATAPAVFVLCKDEEAQWVRPQDHRPHGDIDRHRHGTPLPRCHGTRTWHVLGVQLRC